MDLIQIYLFYSFFGFLLEFVYAQLSHSRKRDRKCRLLLPLCPVYGIGAAAILSLPAEITSVPILLFIAGGTLATAAEYFVSLFYGYCWQVSFWDYSHLPGNLHGRVCLWFSLIWGVLSVGLVYYIHPLVHPLLSAFPPGLLAALCAVFLWDTAATTVLLRQQKNPKALQWYRRGESITFSNSGILKEAEISAYQHGRNERI